MAYTSDTQRALQAGLTRADAGKREQNLVAGASSVLGAGLDAQITRFRNTRVGTAVYNTGEAATNLDKMVTAIKSGKIDAAGIANVANPALAMMGNITQALTAISGDAGRVAAEVTQWATIGANCAVGGLATGGLGYASCGLQVLAKIFGYFGSGPSNEAWTTPRTIFAPTKVSAGLISGDAARLLSALYYYYGVRDYASLYDMLANHSEFRCLRRDSEMGLYPSQPLKDPASGKVLPAAGSSRKPLPGHNLRTILQMFSFGMTPQAALFNNRDALAALAGWRRGKEPGGRGLYQRFEWYQDLNQRTIAEAAYWGRSSLAAGNGTKLNFVVFQSGDLASWPGQFHAGGAVFNADVMPFIVLDELINFFGGVTARELVVGGGPARDALSLEYGIGVENPTRHLFVCDDNQRAIPGDCAGGSKYSTKCWTSLSRASGSSCNAGSMLGGWASNDALREIGAVRLMSAFSLLHQMYLWSNVSPNPLSNPFAKLTPYNPSDPATELQVPVDMRQVIGGQLRAEEVKAGAKTGELRQGDTKVRGAFVPAHRTARVSPTALSAKVAREQALLQQALASQKHLYSFNIKLDDIEAQKKALVQAWTSARASGLDFDAALARAKAQQSGSGAGGVVLLGAAALLALKFLK